jgi:hypothetical protein
VSIVKKLAEIGVALEEIVIYVLEKKLPNKNYPE